MLRGDRLRTLRESKGYTHAELAEMLGLGYAQVYRYESNKTDPSGEILDRIASVFSVSVDYLLGRTDDPTPSISNLTDTERSLLAALRRKDYGAIIKTLASYVQ
jgi:transcriptional regulator with XRE-family HTH domain